MTRPPSADTVRRLVDRVLAGDPEEERRIEPVHEGGEHATWRVGDRYVLRLAPDRAASARQRREAALREAVAAKLSVPVPRSAATGEWDEGRTYTLDLAPAGESAEQRPVPAAGERDLAALLSGLADFPVREAEALGVPRTAARQVTAVWTGAERARGAVRGREAEFAALRRLETVCPATPAAGTPTALVHHDLKGEHLLLTPAGRVSGVLDWTDAVLGDPAEDIAGLALSIGATAALRVAANAGYGTGMCARALQLVRCDTLVRLAARLAGVDDSPLPLLRTQRARAGETTPLDESAAAVS
ncbi:aminoglycoside phosphotransferase family protein [Streptomyces sp. NBC_01795]|uniref:phosphotransferase family protein n=1 Tax=Streptomyces sp. NBC_01795 TaxID=2975943 RepID=UPI002DDC8EA5|nr:aminoglycoside phosphotransferase family protein [Streptomyces sp. NBC_01795]WSA91512.1 aminoglycoside phosphotransferase family protein [Streptomyces sp. NBC_01795]